MLDNKGADLIRLGEAFNLAIVDGTHESGFSGTNLSTETVTMTTLEPKSSSVEKNLGTVSQRELAVAQIFTLFFVLVFVSVFRSVGCQMDDQDTSDGDRVSGGGDKREVRCESVDEISGQNGRVHGVHIFR